MPMPTREVWGRLVRVSPQSGVTGPTGPTGPAGGGATITGSAGQVAVCDGFGNAAGGSNLVWDSGSKTLTVAQTAVLDDGNGLLLTSDVGFGSGAANIGLFRNGGFYVSGGSANISWNPAGDVVITGLTLGIGNDLLSVAGGNAIDIGVSGAPFRTGYFGTSVVSPLFVAGATPGITDTIPPGSTINVVGGIIVGFTPP